MPTPLSRREIELSSPILAARRSHQIEKVPDRVMFRPAALYGLSKESVKLPLNRTDHIETGQICVTSDAEAAPGDSVGFIDFEEGRVNVRYAIQAVFPGLYELVQRKDYDPALLQPVRAVATDECTMTPDRSGFRALGCLEILPGSIWAGAEGG